ncbi:MAG: 30S ribosomal protein S11 [Caldisericia bacterium]|nr:30S ribosomal protein S11 [Caldisericia bacterium]MDD4615330.1 30S ribosomal protein S11 [Caldisericia bacterium]
MAEEKVITNQNENASGSEVVQAEDSDATLKASSTPKASRKKGKKRAPVDGKAFIKATFNNTTVSITNNSGDVICWGTAGVGGFKGTRKGTAYAAQVAAEHAAKKAIAMGMRSVRVFVKGPGPGRETSIRALSAAGLDVSFIADVTPIPHNGCRPRKPRRS